MTRRPLPRLSTRIASVGWDDNVMEVEFRSGQVYHYFGVSEAEYQALLGADSPGRHLDAHVIPRFEARKLQG